MPLFHHIHHAEEACEKVGVKPKHEHYFFPKQYNQHLEQMPVSYFGFDPSVTKEEVIERLKDFTVRDTRITELSRAFRIELDTGWYTPASVVIPIDKLSMLVTIAFSWLVFHERLTKKAAVGVLLITVGTVLLVII